MRRESVTLVERTCRSALNPVRGMPFNWSLNPYTGCVHRCTFCYVRAFERRADRAAGDGYGRTVLVKTNVVTVLRTELARRSWQREQVAIGSATDPYQPAEGRYRLTRGCLEALLERRNPASLITRGPMVVRDADVLAALSSRAKVTVCISVPSLDPDVVARTEPGTAPPRQRLRALRILVDSGVRAGVLMAPILPGISDDPRGLREVMTAARDAGAAFIGAGPLRLAPGTREHFMEHLGADWPELVAQYRRLFGRGAGLPATYTTPLQQTVAELREELKLDPRPFIAPAPQPLQLALPLAS
ncbi:MAG TPA: radical SAM protein [Candidatus Dormibacteraeota bacterium]|jgi:DNA repair photolyase|nr:radical SAM protein [Candidatus Dormibacteraeota bacterium]